MEDIDTRGWQRKVSRRRVLQGAGAATLGALGLWLVGCSDEEDDKPAATTTTAPAATSAPGAASTPSGLPPGERVPTITSVHINSDFWTQSLRQFVGDWKEIGIETKLVPVSTTEWLQVIFDREYGDIEAHGSPLRPERFDPTEWIVSRAYGPEGVKGKRNYGNYKSKAYDTFVEEQLSETDLEKRKQAVFNAQQILREDHYTNALNYPSIAEAYNAEDWEPRVEALPGNGLFGNLMPYALIEARPLGSSKRFTAGVTNGPIDTTNVINTRGGGRNVLRLIYDTLVKLDKDLGVRGWAMESWNQIDGTTWDMKLRPGMKFHDGKPVRPEDVKFTFDRLIAEEPGILSLVWRPVNNVEIVDRGEGVLRFHLNQVRSDFLTIIAMLAPVLPEHVWKDAPTLSDFIVDSPETAVGSGPFQWVNYRKDDQLLMKANRDHFLPPVMDEHLILNAPTVDGNIGRLQAKEIDRTTVSSASLLDEAAKFSHVKTAVTSNLGWNMMLPFIERMPWRDIEFRKAWFASTDKNFTVEVVLEGLGEIAEGGSFISPFGPWGNPNLEPTVFDLELARTILSNAGYSWDGSGRLLYPNAEDPDFKRRIDQVLARPDDWWGPGVDEVGPPDGRV